MLKEIKCEKFSDSIANKTIYFKNGLNCIVGADDALNSIGKSTLLMIIDFCFGGSDYCKNGSDILESIGHHTIFFCFEFRGDRFYFSRNTSTHNYYNICDSAYNTTSEKRNIDELQDFLKECYFGTTIEGSFRSVVNGFSRIYGKNNYDVNKPLKTYNNDAVDKNGINVLLDLFGKKGIINKQLNDISYAEKSKKALDSSKKYGLIYSLIKNKNEYENAARRIENLKNEINKMVEQENQFEIVLDDNITQKDIDLKTEQINLMRKRNSFNFQLKNLNSMVGENLLMDEEDLNKINKYFPNIETKSLLEINNFQKQLILNVNEEIMKQKRTLENNVKQIDDRLKEINEELLSDNISPKISKTFLENVMQKNSEISKLEEQMLFYKKTEKIKKDVQIAKDKLETDYSYILSNIEKEINDYLKKLNDKIYIEKRMSPVLTLESFAKYSYKTPKDKGTGTEFKGLLLFDLSILELTKLPFIIDDSLLFKNLWNEPVEGLFRTYNNSKKQIFIAIDRIQVFNDEAQEIISKHEIVKLGNNKKSLFGFMWAKNKS